MFSDTQLSATFSPISRNLSWTTYGNPELNQSSRKQRSEFLFIYKTMYRLSSFCLRKWKVEILSYGSTLVRNLSRDHRSSFHSIGIKVSVLGVAALGGHFATLCQELDFHKASFFQKENENTLTYLIIFIVKSLQKEVL